MRTHRMRALAAIAAVFVLIAAACEHDNPAAPTTTTTTPEPTTTTTAPDPEPEDAGPLQLSLTIHVEGRGQAVTNEAAFDIHTGLVEQVADAAEDEGALVSFDLSNDFAVAASRWDSTIATDLEDRGHAIGLHADVGGQGNPTFGALVSELSAMHDNVTALGIDTAHVSGICSEGPWVEAALAAGFTATNGLVEYCYKSLSLANLPADHTDVLDCNSPALCHTPAPDEIDYKVHPWWVSDSSDWLTADADGEMLLMTGVGGAPFACDGGPNDPGSCGAAEVQSGDDFADLIEQYLAARDDDRVASLNMTWSVGSAPDDAKMAEILGAAVPYVDSGEAEWATVPAVAELAELNRIEADPGDGDGGGEATGTAPATYLVIHADPQQADDLGYERLVAFMDELAADSDSGNAHKITILLSAQFADYLGQDASRRTEAAGWIADGHELGFHHHTAGHL